MSAKVLRVVMNVNMNNSHLGLTKLLKDACKIDVSKIETGTLIMCVNKKGDKLKVIGGRGLVIGYLKMPSGQRIMMESLRYIPETFGAEGIDYDKACKRAIEERFTWKPKGPLANARAIRNLKERLNVQKSRTETN